MVSVSGTAFGERNYKKASSALLYATRTGFLAEAAIAAAVYIFDPELTRLLKIMTVFYPAVTFGMLSASQVYLRCMTKAEKAGEKC